VSITDQFGQYAEKVIVSAETAKSAGTGPLLELARSQAALRDRQRNPFGCPSATKEFIMSIDLFMNDTCPKCRQLLMPAVIGPHPTRRNLSVHKPKCANCGAVQTSILIRKSHGALADKPVANAR
jgi:hypothetical protein